MRERVLMAVLSVILGSAGGFVGSSIRGGQPGPQGPAGQAGPPGPAAPMAKLACETRPGPGHDPAAADALHGAVVVEVDLNFGSVKTASLYTTCKVVP